jgi:hypothetical protein
MKPVLKNILRKKSINLIKKLGNGVFEIIIDIDLSFITINSIEYDEKSDSIFLHSFGDDHFDLIFDFEDLREEDMFKVIKFLNRI